MRVSTEPDRCVALGQCVMIAPTVFDSVQDDDGVVVLIKEQTDGPEVLESVCVCPATAISATD
jgi:ferredoxin